LYTRGYVRIDPSIDRRRIIVSILGLGIQRLRKFPMKAWVSQWACALNGVVFGGTLRAYVENKGILEINAKRAYELGEEVRPSSSSVAV
jgi:hypothetical protein